MRAAESEFDVPTSFGNFDGHMEIAAAEDRQAALKRWIARHAHFSDVVKFFPGPLYAHLAHGMIALEL